ncbi:MAG: VCBS repeat-containing protein [Planctomycetales bacterium]|nr:VCBS repeat-containing protein [Planctomycetales bacterium]
MRKFLSRRRVKSSRAKSNLLRRQRVTAVETLEHRKILAVVATDLPDYAPGDTAQIYAAGFDAGETVEFQVLHNDAVPNTGNGHAPWRVTDGSAQDLDGMVDGNIHTTWYVDPDDSADSSFDLTALGLDSGLSAANTFTDTGGDYSLDFVAAGPLTYDHTTGGGAYDDRTIGDNMDVVESLEGGSFKSGDIVSYFVEIAVGDLQDGKVADQHLAETLELEFTFGTRATNGLEVGHVQVMGVGINYGPIARSDLDGNMSLDIVGDGPGETDSAINDDFQPGTISSAANPVGSTATLVSQMYNDGSIPNGLYPDANTNADDLIARIRIDDLESNETVILRIDVLIGNGDDASGSANIQAKLSDKDVVAAIDMMGMPVAYTDTIPGGVQTIPFKNIQLIVVGNPAIDIEKATNGQDADMATGPQLPVGSTATFTYTVTNPGDVALANVSVIDDNGTPGNNSDDFAPTFIGGDTNNNNLLDVDETWIYEATRTVTAGQYTNVAVVTGEDAQMTEVSDNDPSNHFGVDSGIHIEKSTNGQDADSPTGPLLAIGSTASFSYVVTNTGNVPLSNVVLVDDNGTPGNAMDDFSPLFVTGDANMDGKLDTNEAWIYTAMRTVTAGQYSNLGKVTSEDPLGAMVMDDDPSHHYGVVVGIDIEKATNGQDADTPTGPMILVGDTATFTYVVTNTGEVPLQGILIFDDAGTPGNTLDDFVPTYTGGDTNNDGFLDIDETWTYEATHTVTAGQYGNTGYVQGNTDTGTFVTDTDPSHHYGVEPVLGIDIEKATNGQDADNPTGPMIAVGDTATFTYEVTNTGNVPFVTIIVLDDAGTPGNSMDDFSPTYTGGDTNNNGELDPGETWMFEATHVVTPGQYANVGAVRGSTDQGQFVLDTDPSHHFGVLSSIDVEKATNGMDSDTPTGEFLEVGSTATFTYVVTNTGNAPLSNVVLVDDNGTPGNAMDDFNPTYTGGDTNNDGILDLDETWTYEASKTVTVGQHQNIGKVTAEGAMGEMVMDSDPSNHFGYSSRIKLHKYVNGDDANTPPGVILAVGDTATFTYEVRNPGNIDLHNVVLIDDNGTPGNTMDDFMPTYVSGDLNNNNILEKDEIWYYTASRIVTPGLFTNTAVVTGEDQLGNMPSFEDVANHTGIAPGIDVEKATNGQDADSPTGPYLAVGDTATFTYTVTNSGLSPLANVSLIDDNGTPGNGMDDFAPMFIGGDTNNDGLLDVGEVWTYSASRVVTAGQYTNKATASGTDEFNAQVSDMDPSNHFGVVSGIDIEKATNLQDADMPTGPLLAAGSTATFTYVVTNTGNSPLSGVSVIDDNGTPGDSMDDFSPMFVSGDTNNDGLLDVGETWIYAATRTVTAGQYTNNAKVTATDALQAMVMDSDPSNHFGVDSSIDVEKATNGMDSDTPTGEYLEVGSTATFTYVVTNTGNVPLSNVVLVDDNDTPGNTMDDFNPSYTGGDTNNDGILDLDETWTYEASKIVTVGQHQNIGKVTAEDILGDMVMDSDPSNHFGRSTRIKLHKYVNGDDANTAPGVLVKVGDTATFTYEVRNPGNVSLFNVVLIDDNGTPGDTMDDFMPTYVSGDLNNNNILEKDEIWYYTADRVVTPGQYTNIAKVTGEDEFGNMAMFDDPANHFGVDSGIHVEKATNGQDADSPTGPLIAVGDTATFTYVVTNTGNVPLSNVSLLDDNGTPGNAMDDFMPMYTGGDTNMDGLLDVDEAWTYTASRTVTAGQYTNMAKVTGTDSLQDMVMDDDPSNHFGVDSRIDIEKLVNGMDADFPMGPILYVGDTATFTFIVTNPGNVPLSDVNVVDNNGTPGDTMDDFSPMFVGGDTNMNNLLDTNETWIYTAELPVKPGQQTNKATVTADDPLEETVMDMDVANYFGERSLIVIGPDKGNESVPIVKVVDKRDGSIIHEFLAYETDFRGGVRVATGDVDGDGVDEIITAPGRGREAEFRVFEQDGTELTQFRTLTFGPGYDGGISIAVGDINGDGLEDFVVGTSTGKGKVKVYYNNFPAADPVNDVPDEKFKPFGNSFLGGIDVAVADMGWFSNGATVNANLPDGNAEILVATGPGTKAKIKVYEMSNGAQQVDKIVPFGSFRGGITIDTALVDGDLIPDIIVGGGNGKASKVKIISGLTNDATDQTLAKFKTFDDTASKHAPVHAVGVDTNGDGYADLISVVQGTDGDSGEIRCFKTNGDFVKSYSGFDGPWNIAAIDPLRNEMEQYEIDVDEFFQGFGQDA